MKWLVQRKLPAFLAAALLALSIAPAVSAAPAPPTTPAGNPQIDIGGILIPLDNQNPFESFSTGNAGRNFIASRYGNAFVLPSNPVLAPDCSIQIGTGLCGVLSYQERVVRISGGGSQPTYNALATQRFSGDVLVNGTSVWHGTFVMNLTARGDLVAGAPIDANPDIQHATTMEGTWAIASNNGTGSPQGHGIIDWSGVGFIAYQGTVIL